MADDFPVDDAPRFDADDMPEEAHGAEPVEEAFHTHDDESLGAAAWVLALEGRTDAMSDAAKQLDDAYAADRYEDALAAATELMAAVPENPRPYLYRGMVHIQMEQMQSAIQDFDHALELDPNAADLYVQRGRARYAIEDTEGALQDFKQAVKVNPQYAPAYMERGYAFFSRGAVEAALNDFKQYCKLVPENPIGFNNQAFTALWLGRTSAAESLWRKATSLPGAPPWAYAGHAVALYRMKKRKQAEEQYRKAIELDPRWRDNLEEVSDDFSWPESMLSAAREMLQRMG